MRKTTLALVAVLLLVLLVSSNAYAMGGENCPISGFFNSVGGFLYNALPWNWGNWVGK